MRIYGELKQLFDFSDDTIDLYFNLKARASDVSNNLLIICKDESSLNKIHGDILKIIRNDETNRNIFVKTIDECKTLRNDKFKKIVFFD